MAKTSALVFGIIFLIVGILGFIPGNGIAGMGALFETETVHNIIHIIFGLILLYVATKAVQSAGTALVVVGIIYIILAIIGFIQGDSLLGLHINAADNWLHLVLGVVIGALGLAGKKGGASASTMSSSPQM